MSTKSKFKSGVLTFYDGTTFETVAAKAPVVFQDDFCGPDVVIPASAESGCKWLKKIVGSGVTVARVANQANGVVAATLLATDEAEDAILYSNDCLELSTAQGLVFECRAALHVVPTTGTEKANAVIGVASAYNANPDTTAVNGWFRLSGDSKIYWEVDDDSTNTAATDTGVVAVADVYHIFRIEFVAANNVLFFIDGAQVGQATVFSPAAPGVQPYIGCNKVKSSANTGLATLYVDYVKIWQKRS